MPGAVTAYYVAHRAMLEAHHKLLKLGLTGDMPRLNMHQDHALPACVYQPNTNCIAACMQKMSTMLSDEIDDAVLDAMAMCGCYRDYQSSKRQWNASQNKARLPVPALAMHGGVKWRLIRSKL